MNKFTINDLGDTHAKRVRAEAFSLSRSGQPCSARYTQVANDAGLAWEIKREEVARDVGIKNSYNADDNTYGVGTKWHSVIVFGDGSELVLSVDYEETARRANRRLRDC